jgi:hypothetical protein
MFRLAIVGLALSALGFGGIACSPSHAYHDGPDDLAKFSDEFGDSATLSNWKRVYQTEGWGANQLQLIDINKTQKGALVLVPYASTWYKDLRGELTYKEIEGDFVMTTRVRSTGRDGRSAPRAQFSLAGIMIRSPRQVTPQSWQPGGENYVFLSLGAADNPGNFQWEVKTTINSDSQLITSPAGGPEGYIQVARIGGDLIMLRNDGNGWSVHRRYRRTDMPKTLQAGLTVYTDWPSCQNLNARQHNATVLRSGNPDLIAQFDFVRYHRPNVPASLRGKNLSEQGQVSDAQLLSFLGEKAAAAGS